MEGQSGAFVVISTRAKSWNSFDRSNSPICSNTGFVVVVISYLRNWCDASVTASAVAAPVATMGGVNMAIRYGTYARRPRSGEVL